MATRTRKAPSANGTAVTKAAPLPSYAVEVIRKAIADHEAEHEAYKRLWTDPIHEDDRWINVAAVAFREARGRLLEAVLATGPKYPTDPDDEWRGLSAHQRGADVPDPCGVVLGGVLYLAAYSDDSQQVELSITPMANVIDLDA